MKKNKIAIVGVGTVGATIAFNAVVQGFADEILLIDKNEDKARAEMLDLEHTMTFQKKQCKVRVGRYEDCGDMDIIIITAAAPLVQGQTRLDMLDTAKKITKSIVPGIMDSGFNGHFIVITNPVDVISYYVWRLSGLPKSRVIGTGTALDSARLQVMLGDIIGLDPNSIQAFTMGEHGDSQFIPWKAVSIGGKSWADILEDNPERKERFDKEQVLANVKDAGWKIARVKNTTNYGISATTLRIVEAILNNESAVIPVSTYLDGEYGVKEVFVSVPAIINAQGVAEIVELRLSEEEQEQFNHSIEVIKSYIKQL